MVSRDRSPNCGPNLIQWDETGSPCKICRRVYFLKANDAGASLGSHRHLALITDKR